jgi:hypothetical protein
MSECGGGKDLPAQDPSLVVRRRTRPSAQNGWRKVLVSVGVAGGVFADTNAAWILPFVKPRYGIYRQQCDSFPRWQMVTSNTEKTRFREPANPKTQFLESLGSLDTLNPASPGQTSLLDLLVDSQGNVDDRENGDIEDDDTLTVRSVVHPGRWESMIVVAPGTWKVVYAPHMTNFIQPFLGLERLDVSYLLTEDGTIVSHAVFTGPVIASGASWWTWLTRSGQSDPPTEPSASVALSVSGTFGSVSNTTCRVDFDQAWVTFLSNSGKDGVPANTIDADTSFSSAAPVSSSASRNQPVASIVQVPDSWSKRLVTTLGRAAFVPQVSVFPVAFLDDNLIVFDFELLGTRICARKQ